MPEETPVILQKIQDFQRELTKLGIDPNTIPKVTAIIHLYSDLQTELEHYRQNQFYDDARELTYQLAGQRQNKFETSSAFLREFAEHIAGYVVDREGRTVDLVDRIPPLHPQEKKGED